LTIIAFGLVIRLIYAIYSHDFWLDEGVNYFIAQNSLSKVLDALSHNNWPPFYSLLMWLWQKVSFNLLWIRLPSVIFGTLTLIIIYKIAKKIFEPKLALLTLVLAIVSPPLVYFSAENRDYGLFTLLTSLMMLAFLNLVQKSNIKNLIFFILSSTVAILTHYFAILALISLIMASFLSLGFKIKLKTLFGALTAISILILPWMIFTFGKEKPDCLCLGPILGSGATFAFMSLGGAGFITLKRFFEPSTPIFLKLFLTGFLAFSTLIFLFAIKFYKNPKIRFLLLCFFLPILFIFLVSFYKPLFSVRSFIFLVPIFLILTTYVLDKIDRYFKFKWLFIIYLVSSASIISLTTQRPFFNQEPLWQTSTLLASFPHQNTQIVHANLYTYLPSRYYYPDLNQQVLAHDLPAPLFGSLKPNLFSTFDPQKSIILVYAIDRTDNRKLQEVQRNLYNVFGQAKNDLMMGKIRILVFSK